MPTRTSASPGYWLAPARLSSDLPALPARTTTGAFTRRREPTTPGEILREEYLKPLGMTQKELADHLAYDVKVVNRIVDGRAAVSIEMALKLGAAFRTSLDFWLTAQKALDLHRAYERQPSDRRRWSG